MRDTENTPKRASVPCYGEERKAVRVEYHRGHFKNPMSDAEMEEKFRSLARKHLAAERVDALLRQRARGHAEGGRAHRDDESLKVVLTNPPSHRHGRACPGHPRLACCSRAKKDVDAATSAGMTEPFDT
jgi:hypothetical protein